MLFGLYNAKNIAHFAWKVTFFQPKLFVLKKNIIKLSLSHLILVAYLADWKKYIENQCYLAFIITKIRHIFLP